MFLKLEDQYKLAQYLSWSNVIILVSAIVLVESADQQKNHRGVFKPFITWPWSRLHSISKRPSVLAYLRTYVKIRIQRWDSLNQV